MLRAHTVLFDIDDTLTHSVPSRSGKNFLSTLVTLVARQHGLSPTAAESKIRSLFDPENETPDAHYDALGISERQLWDAMMEFLPGEVTPFPETAETIKTLHERGFRLFTATTNSGLICRLKLSMAGLADFSGSPYFEALLGGSEVHPEGKSSPAFFHNLLARAGGDPAGVVHVGDLPEVDLALARASGISQVVLPRRNQTPAWVLEPDGGLYLRSLALLPELLRKS